MLINAFLLSISSVYRFSGSRLRIHFITNLF